jgi:hypothetical protein
MTFLLQFFVVIFSLCAAMFQRTAKLTYGSALSGERKGSSMRLKPTAIWGTPVHNNVVRQTA